MKRVAILGLLVVFGAVAGALAATDMWTYISTVGYTELQETSVTDSILIFESVIFRAEPDQPSFELEKHISVPGPEVTVPDRGFTGSHYLISVWHEYKHVVASGGTTEFFECAVAGSTQGAAGYIGEYIRNTDDINITKEVWTVGDWHLAESKTVYGSGHTEIRKHLATWGKTGKPIDHLTDAAADVYFSGASTGEHYYTDGGVLFDELPSFEEALMWCGDGMEDPESAREMFDFFGNRVLTDEPFLYTEKAAINPFWPDLGE